MGVNFGSTSAFCRDDFSRSADRAADSSQRCDAPIAGLTKAMVQGRSHPVKIMTRPITVLVNEILARESTKRREQTVQQIEALNQKYKPGGNWRLLQPGPLWEACEIWIAELRDVGQTTVSALTKSGALASAKPEEIEKAKRVLYDWLSTERDGYVADNLKRFMEARGTLVDEEALTLRARMAEAIAQSSKELLLRLSESVRPAKAAKK